MSHPLRCIANSCLLLAASNAYSNTILNENFESAVLDPRISVSTVGTFSRAPGIKSFSAIQGDQAFGFGVSTNFLSSFENFATNLLITLPAPAYVTSVSFDEMEVFGNWGSRGEVYVDGVQLQPTPLFGRAPYNDFTPDTTFRSHVFSVNDTITTVRIKVWDITNSSEIYLDNLVVSGVPEPQTALLVGGGLLLVAGSRFLTMRRDRMKRVGDGDLAMTSK